MENAGIFMLYLLMLVSVEDRRDVLIALDIYDK